MSAASIAEIEQVSPAYMARALIELKRAGLLVRTKTGYGLTRPAAAVTIAEVFRAVGESIMDVNEDNNRADSGRSIAYMTVHPFWDTMRQNLLTLLDHTTLQDLQRNQPALLSRQLDETIVSSE